MKKHYRRDNDCLNCGIELQGHFCHVCGQENLHIKEPFWHFLGHSISHYFHFDEKFYSTISPLLTKPGQLTLDYLAGRRARYLHPVSMYIFVSIVYFLIIPNLHPKKSDEFNFKLNNKSINEIPADSLEVARKQVLKLPISDEAKRITLLKIDQAEQLAKTKDGKSHVILLKPIITKPALPKTDSDDDDDEDAKPKLQSSDIVFQSLSIRRQIAVMDSLDKLNKQHPTDSLKNKLKNYREIMRNSVLSGPNDKAAPNKDHKFNYWLYRLIHAFDVFNTPNFNEEVEHYKPKMYFILMPLFAFFLMRSFRTNHRYYVEHLVFTIHFFTAFFIFEIIVKPIDYFIFGGSDIIYLLTIAAVCWYCYTALRAFYQRPPWKTVRKMVTLSIMYLIAFGISSSILVSVVYMITEK